MNIIYLIFLCQLVRFGHMFDHPLPPLQNIKMDIIENGDMSISHANLAQTNRMLANEYLPVWILSCTADSNSVWNNDNYQLNRNYEVMEELGPFTTYQDPETSSAVIYFHKRRELNGMIGYEFLIQQFPIDEIQPTETTKVSLDQFGVYRRPSYMGHRNDRKVTDGDPEAGVSFQEPRHTYAGHLYNGYPEVLVIISWDLVQEWTRNVQSSDWYITIVSQVLTLFNAVDMLYSKLQFTNIQINIAGIIIGTTQEAFDFLKDCYYPEAVEHNNSVYRLEGVCVTKAFRHFLEDRKNKIPLDSYDIAVFLTRQNLYKMVGDSQHKKFLPIMGIVGNTYKLYETRERDVGFILVGTVTTNRYLENYPTLAHEMAHLMTVKHDKPQFFTCDGGCCGNIMKTGGKWCDKCLSWSSTSEKSFYFFFSSPNCCAFINTPRSLNPPGRRKMLTADTQCRCYGYKSSKKYWDIRDIIWGFCNTELRCEKPSHKYSSTVIPMDGTPCGIHKVCWGRKCETIETF